MRREEGRTWLVMDEKGDGKTTLLGDTKKEEREIEEGRKEGRRALAWLSE